ncbi:MAG TPA: fluoride efflux transporter CrcB [Stellaceae bacterium]|jgi:CrcB protein|nr:fluoride efflux transporter CrcB [Stellaceae bacterium]
MTVAYLWVALGGALGTIARFWLAAAMARLTGPTFPWGTLLINVVGSFVIGLFGRLTEHGGLWHVSADIRTFVMVGLCGGFTTFSSFGLQTIELMRSKEILRAGAYVVLSVVLCLSVTWAAMKL